MWTYVVKWSLKHKPCPGKEILISKTVNKGDPCPQEVRDVWVPGSGYAIGLNMEPGKVRRLSQAALASVRQKRLVRRMEAKYPLLAEQFINAELSKRPEFFSGIRL